jgi:hypothetical protein
MWMDLVEVHKGAWQLSQNVFCAAGSIKFTQSRLNVFTKLSAMAFDYGLRTCVCSGSIPSACTSGCGIGAKVSSISKTGFSTKLSRQQADSDPSGKRCASVLSHTSREKDPCPAKPSMVSTRKSGAR